MRHRILKARDNHPYEIVSVEIIADNKDEETRIKNVDEVVQDYLLLNLRTVEVIENSSPIFLIKRTKEILGIG